MSEKKRVILISKDKPRIGRPKFKDGSPAYGTGRINNRTHSPAGKDYKMMYCMKQYFRRDFRCMGEDNPAKLNMSELIPLHNFKGDFWHGYPKKKLKHEIKFDITSFIFEFCMNKIMRDMIHNKNVYTVYKGIDFIIGTKIDKNDPDNVQSFFTFDTVRDRKQIAENSEAKGFVWKVYPSKKMTEELNYYTKYKNYRYILCRTLHGKQCLAIYSLKLRLLIRKLSKKGLSRSFILQRLNCLPQTILNGGKK